MRLTNLAIEYELRVKIYSWESESRVNIQTKNFELRKMRYVLHKIYELPVENLSFDLQDRNLSREGIFMLAMYIAWT